MCYVVVGLQCILCECEKVVVGRGAYHNSVVDDRSAQHVMMDGQGL